jgi:septation ring formation regulator EzrA
LVLRHGHGSYASPLAADRVRWKVEDRLGHVMDQLEQLAVVAEQRRLVRAETQQHEAARRELEQQAAENAHLLRERVRRLDEQIDRWERATRIRRFVDAARSGAAADASSDEWLDWANSFADSIDPITAGLGPITA